MAASIHDLPPMTFDTFSLAFIIKSNDSSVGGKSTSSRQRRRDDDNRTLLKSIIDQQEYKDKIGHGRLR
jgi:hypothetical protein